ncbi:MAG: WYL domain-containing protein [Deltaproteobacteria bacterium]|nr:WYL domain-containing protein [Deltaproteobacteria bacterium]
MTKTERWLNLLAFLLDHRRPVPREEILSQVEDYKTDWIEGSERSRESVRRKFERDKAELKELGVVIEPLKEKIVANHSDQEVEAYQLKPREFYLPYLKVVPPLRSRRGGQGVRPEARPYFLNEVALASDELPILRRAAERIAALTETPLGSAARAVIRKLSFDLPEANVGAEERAFPAPSTVDQQFAILRQAVEQRRAVQCRYYTIRRDSEEKRVIEPYGLMLSWGHWYCVARARERDALRVFRLDRMKNCALIEGEKGEFAVPKNFRISSYLNRAPWELSDDKPVTARVRINFPQSRWVIGERLGKVVKAVTDDAGSEFEFEVRAVDAFVRWLLPLGNQVEVLSPPSIKNRLEEARAQLRAVYP